MPAKSRVSPFRPNATSCGGAGVRNRAVTELAAGYRRYVTVGGVRVSTPTRDRDAITACVVCGGALRPPGYSGRPGKYCSDRCRWAYWTSRRTDDRRTRARRVLHQAVLRGKIAKPDACEQCGAGGQIDGHHHDYALPLAVAWLCRQCHELRHPRGLPDVRLPLEPERT